MSATAEKNQMRAAKKASLVPAEADYSTNNHCAAHVPSSLA
jgi:hypothetical protein